MIVGLVASRRHRSADGALIRWLQTAEPVLGSELDAGLWIVGQTHDDLAALGALPATVAVRRLPSRRDGGLIQLVDGIVAPAGPAALDAVIYMLDPDDPTSVFPEGLALKRQCVIHRKPYIGSGAQATEWIGVERVLRGGRPAPDFAAQLDPVGRTVALVAHDSRKPALMEFVRRHLALFDRFDQRIATGTTGGLLNQLAVACGRSGGRPWVECLRSGPDGGDAQIAARIIAGRCDRVFFFEDPHVAREHEADIQLLERSARMRAHGVPCFTEEVSAERWAMAAERALAARSAAGGGAGQ